MSSCGRTHLADQVDKAIDDLFELAGIVALRHDTDKGLGAGGTDDEAALVGKLALRIGDRALDMFVLKRLAALEADILEKLRHRLETVADLADRLAQPLHRGENL